MDQVKKSLRIDRELNNKLKIKLIEDNRFKNYQEFGEWIAEKYAAGKLDDIIKNLKE